MGKGLHSCLVVIDVIWLVNLRRYRGMSYANDA